MSQCWYVILDSEAFLELKQPLTMLQIVGRIIAGLAVGIIYFAIPQCKQARSNQAVAWINAISQNLDQSEIAPAEHR